MVNLVPRVLSEVERGPLERGCVMVLVSADCELSDDFPFDLLPSRVINTDMQASFEGFSVLSQPLRRLVKFLLLLLKTKKFKGQQIILN